MKYCTCMVLILYPFTQIFIISHKGTIFSQNKNYVSECIFFFRYKNVASKSFYQSKIHPFPLMLMQTEKWNVIHVYTVQGRIKDFKLGGLYFKKLRRAEGGAKIFGVFRVKKHDFTPKNHIFSNFRGARAGCAPLWIRPCR